MVLAATSYAGNDVLGEIDLAGATKVEKTSGVWVDGQYVGYLKELKGSKKILLLPGEHEIVVRQGGYKDFSQKVMVQPGGKQLIRVAMEKDLRMQMPTITAEVKLSVILQSVYRDIKLLRRRSTWLQIRNSRLRRSSARATFRQILSPIRNRQ